MLLGAVDLGSNSFRVEIGRVDGDRIVTQSYWKETIRMAAGFDKNGALTPEMQEKALAALSRFHEKLAGLPATQVRAVGTQALREAANSSEFLPKAEAALGYPIGILSGHEEARLVFKGCARTLPPSDKRRLVVDIGGASTEFVVGQDLEAQEYESYHVGCVNTSMKFFADGVITAEKLDKAIVACCAEFSEGEHKFNDTKFDEAYGSAGTFGAVSDICVAQGWSDGEVTPEHLEKIRALLLRAGNINNIQFPGLKPDRREVIAGGYAVLTAVYRTAGIKSMPPAAPFAWVFSTNSSASSRTATPATSASTRSSAPAACPESKPTSSQATPLNSSACSTPASIPPPSSACAGPRSCMKSARRSRRAATTATANTS